MGCKIVNLLDSMCLINSLTINRYNKCCNFYANCILVVKYEQ